jgi:uncharacterized membrane protein
MKRTTGLSVHNSPQPFNQPDGIETAAIDNLTNLVALPDPALTHSEVFIVGTEPFAPVAGAPAGIALGPLIQPEITLAEKVTALRADAIVLTSDTRGRKVYINPGVLLLPDPSR